ncbi:MAG: MFS transporter [Acidimicrobiia bacterium]|nr:MFS transporter [Acidimicrobiia bacterium]RZV43878.1 MAG: MFS transporter [Acidimicrobiales bacterium]
MSAGRIDHFSVGVLGLLTICSYGVWYYSFGVLLEPIRVDTGWGESTLAASFSAGTVLIGLSALFGGRLLDRAGHRPVFLMGALIGGAGLLIASFATNVSVFFVSSATALGGFGALGFYHVTMATAVRFNPADSSRAIAVLTIWGALASVVFLPLSDALVEALGWRSTVRVLAAIGIGAFVAAAALLPGNNREPTNGPRPSVADVLIATVSSPAARWFTIAVACGGVAMATLLVYQVPVMVAAGLSSTTAATMAGVRGFCQLGGRLPLAPIVQRLGRDRSLVLAFAALMAGGALLAVSGTISVALLFSVVAGFGIGAFSPLQGMKAEELFDRDVLGAMMGTYGAILLLAGSVGPVTAGIIAEQTGERRWASLIVVVAATGALVSTIRLSRLP